MDKFHIKGSAYIPNINFDPDSGVLEIAGESYHEYTTEFYAPVFDWLENYLKDIGKEATPGKQVQMNFKMTYFNTSSSRRFIEILTMLEDYQKDQIGKEQNGESSDYVIVNWYYEENDVDMQESGEEYEEDVDLKFNLIPIPPTV